jgi:hypothetical protein
MSYRFAMKVCLCVGMLAACGCVKVQQTDKRGAPVTKVQDASSGVGEKSEPNVVMVPPSPGPTGDIFYETMDPCAARLHDLEGLLLKYYVAYRKLPDRLEDVTPMAGPGQRVNFNCPLCDKPYVYIPAGGVGVAGQVLAYAPVPAKDGKFRAIKLRAASGTALGALPDVVALTPEEMKPYLNRATPQ